MEPLHVPSLKEACVQRLEGLILSGEWQMGMRLPSERDLAAEMNISRPVLHEALVDLEAKGLVSIAARRGVFVSDYRTSGSCALLSSLFSYTAAAWTRLSPSRCWTCACCWKSRTPGWPPCSAALLTWQFEEILKAEASIPRETAGQLNWIFPSTC